MAKKRLYALNSTLEQFQEASRQALFYLCCKLLIDLTENLGILYQYSNNGENIPETKKGIL